jgi:flavin-dependent dehydrogenase
MKEIETIIVGGGPAGASAACRLASAGRNVVVLERTATPHHKVCGEFLSIETQALLRSLGVDPLACGAVPIDRVTIDIAGRQMVSALPFRALSLSRRRFDEALLARAKEAGAQVGRGVSVQSVRRDGNAWTVHCDAGPPWCARNLVLATGKWRLRGVNDSRDGSLVGLKMHLRLPATSRDALERRVMLFMLDRSYVGVELVEDGIANLCLVMAREIATGIGPGWPVLRAHLASRSQRLAALLDGAEPLFGKPLAVVCPAGGHIDDEAAPAVYRVGDRLAHIPPFTGDGLAIATASGALAARHILQGRSPAAYHAAARALVGRPVCMAGAVSRLAGHRVGRGTILGAATLVPGVVGAVVRGTRLPAAALPLEGQDVSYAPVRA